MRPCPHCGRGLPDDARGVITCPHCGIDVAPEGSPRAERSPAEPEVHPGREAREAARRARRLDSYEGLSLAFRAVGDHASAFMILGALNALIAFVLLFPLSFIPAVQRVTRFEELGIEVAMSDLLASLPFAVFEAFIDTAINLAFAGAAAVIVYRHARGKPVGLRDALQSFSVNGGTVLVTAIIMSAILLGGLVLLVIPLFIFLHWFLFAPAIAAIEGTSVSDALGDSRAFAQGNRTVAYMFIVLGFVLGLNLVAGAVTNVISNVDVAIGLAVGSAIHDFLNPIVGAVAAGLYVLHKEQQAQAARPRSATIARPMGAQTTRCPACGTDVLFHYKGEPVAISCPTCGKSATVR